MQIEDSMPIQITGVVHHNSGSPLKPASQDAFSVEAIVDAAIAQERAGYDQVLIANTATMPDSNTIAAFVAARTSRLKLLVAHRPGFMAPTLAARMLATVDRLSEGRVTVHIIAGPSDQEVQADGDFTSKEERYARAREYVSVMRKVWAAPDPFDFEGEFYRLRQSYAMVKPQSGGAIPVSWAGTSDPAVEGAGQCADVFAMSGNSLGTIRATMDRVEAAAGRHGRTLDYMVTLLAIVGDTQEAAWTKADRVLEEFMDMKAKAEAQGEKGPTNFDQPSHAATMQLLTASRGAVQDRCLWMGVTEAAKGKFGNQAALVGTPEQITEAVMDYYRMGVSRFLLRGFRPVEDIPEFGEKLFPLLRQAADREDALLPA